MDRGQARNICKIGILFATIMFVLSGCLTPPKEPAPKKSVLNDVYVFHDLAQVDLDKDGQKEIVAIYVAALNSSGVKVIKFHGEKGDIIFEHVFDTPTLKFMMKGKTPTLMAEYKGDGTGCSSRKRVFYRWEGSAFVPAKK